MANVKTELLKTAPPAHWSPCDQDAVKAEPERAIASSLRRSLFITRVLADATQWRHISRFIYKWPQWVIDFHRRELAKRSNWPLASKLSPLLYPHSVGLLPQMAILANDEVMFRALRTLARENPTLQRHAKLQFDTVMECAVHNQNVDTLAWTFAAMREDPHWVCERNLMQSALKRPSTKIVKWLLENLPRDCTDIAPEVVGNTLCSDTVTLRCVTKSARYQFSDYALSEAATYRLCRLKGPSINELKLLLRNHKTLQWSPLAYARALETASSTGNMDAVILLHAKMQQLRLSCTTRAMDDAPQYGQLHVVEFLHTNRSEGCSTDAMDIAAACAHLDVVQFLQAKRTEGCTSYAMNEAARNGDLDMLQLLHTHRFECCMTTRTMDMAARCSNLDVVRFLHEHRAKGYTRAAINMAARRQHYGVLKFLVENRHEEFFAGTLRRAAVSDVYCSRSLALKAIKIMCEHSTLIEVLDARCAAMQIQRLNMAKVLTDYIWKTVLQERELGGMSGHRRRERDAKDEDEDKPRSSRESPLKRQCQE